MNTIALIDANKDSIILTCMIDVPSQGRRHNRDVHLQTKVNIWRTLCQDPSYNVLVMRRGPQYSQLNRVRKSIALNKKNTFGLNIKASFKQVNGTLW